MPLELRRRRSRAASRGTRPCPRSSACAASAACESWRVAMTTASTSGSSSSLGGVRRDPVRARAAARRRTPAAPSRRPPPTSRTPSFVRAAAAASSARTGPGRRRRRAARPRAEPVGGRGAATATRSDGGRGPRRVAQQDRHAARLVERRVGLDAALERELVGHQRLEPDAPGRDLVEEVRDQPPLRPADVADRVVVALDLVLRVVAPRPVGARQPQLQLLLVERAARHVEADVADHRHDRAIARELGRRARSAPLSLAAAATITASAPAPALTSSTADCGRVIARRVPRPRPRRARPRARTRSALGSMATTRAPAAVASCAASWPIRPRPIDRHDLAGGHLGDADAVRRRSRRARANAPQRSVQLGRERDAQRRRHDHALGVAGDVRADAADAVAGPRLLDARADRLDDAGAGVAGRHQVVEPRPHGGQRRPDAVAQRLVDDLAHLVGAVQRLADQRAAGRARDRLLGAGRDQRPGGADQHVPGPGARIGQRRRPRPCPCGDPGPAAACAMTLAQPIASTLAGHGRAHPRRRRRAAELRQGRAGLARARRASARSRPACSTPASTTTRRCRSRSSSSSSCRGRTSSSESARARTPSRPPP